MQENSEKTKKKNLWVKKRHARVFAFLRFAMAGFLRLKYHYKAEKAPIEKGPCLILHNHQATMDPFFVSKAFRFPVYFITSDDLFNLKVSPLIRYLAAPIPKSKSMTDLAAVCTHFIGVAFRKWTGKGAAVAKVGLGGLFPILFNAFVIPAVIVFLCSEGADATIAVYWATFGAFLLTETVWVLGLGVPLYAFVANMRKRGVSAFSDGKKKALPPASAPDDPTQPTPQA